MSELDAKQPESSLWVRSAWNLTPDLRAQLPARVELYDVTLRDGVQCACAEWSANDRLRLAQYAAAMGVRRLEAGRACDLPGELDKIQQVVELQTGMTIQALVELSPDDIDRAASCGVDGVTVLIPSARHILAKAGLALDAAIDLAVEMIARARRHKLRVTFFPTYTPLADPADLTHIVTRLDSEQPFDSLTLVDTLGVLTPHGVGPLCRHLRSLTARPLEVHFHNDYGMATANTIAALAHGASVAHVTLGGIGERAGNACLEEVVCAAQFLLGVDCGIDTTRLGRLNELLRHHTGFARAANAPINGDALYQIKLELIQRGYFDRQVAGPFHYGFPMHWDAVGTAGPEPVLGQDATEFGLDLVLEISGLMVPATERADLLRRIISHVARTHQPVRPGQIKDFLV